ncbi:hypothetical protein [Millisia brevis]|uniref:hypothetical protein n=1 Tax=Millisia brevis TaxID=264148 RepID=UPI0008367042|nr:hypothetical protein [Millisia brevis]
MFRKLAALLKGKTLLSEADAVFTFHPEQLSRWLEEVWATGGVTTWGAVVPAIIPGSSSVPLGNPDTIAMTKLPDPLRTLLSSGVNTPSANPNLPLPLGYNTGGPALGTGTSQAWDHMFYAYLVESTGIIEIMSEVVRRYVTGESLPTPTIATTAWLRGTEDIFFRDPPLFRIASPTSALRPDARVNRRNAYWRMFGLDLPHPAAGVDGQPWKLGAGPASNTRFLELWNELLRQVWLGIENEKNSSGQNPTDISYVAFLCQTIGEMLRLRRRGGLLSREEFGYVCMMNWFHLTVETDSAVVVDLSATAGAGSGNPADRLTAIGRRVGIEPSRQTRELFELADLLSPVLWSIELGLFDDPTAAELLFKLHNITPPATDQIAKTMNRTIDLWQSATGETVKDLAVTQRRGQSSPRSAQPTRLLVRPTAAPIADPSTNGHPVHVGR